MKVAYVKWRDACTMIDGSRTADDLGDLSDLESGGIWVGETAERVTIALDCNPDGRYRYVTHIPKVNIIEMRTVDVDAMTKRKVRR